VLIVKISGFVPCDPKQGITVKIFDQDKWQNQWRANEQFQAEGKSGELYRD